MGFEVTIINGHATIIKDQKIYKEFEIQNWEDTMMKSLKGADYVEPFVGRHMWRPKWHDSLPGGNQVIDADDYSLGVGWRAHMNTTHAQLHQDFSTAQREWNESPEHEALIAQMQYLKANGDWKVTNLVALGIGSLHEPLNPLPCVVQDPAYSELEKDFFRSSLNLEVVDDPDAFSCINAGSLVMNIGTYFDMAWWIDTGTWPAAMITNDWGNPRPLLQLEKNTPPFCLQRVCSMFQHYNSKPLIREDDDDDDGRWARVNLYWRR